MNQVTAVISFAICMGAERRFQFAAEPLPEGGGWATKKGAKGEEERGNAMLALLPTGEDLTFESALDLCGRVNALCSATAQCQVQEAIASEWPEQWERYVERSWKEWEALGGV